MVWNLLGGLQYYTELAVKTKNKFKKTNASL